MSPSSSSTYQVDRRRSVMVAIAAVATSCVLSFIFVEVYNHSPAGADGRVDALRSLAIALIPNTIAVLIVFIALSWLRVYGLSETHDQLDKIYTFLDVHVKQLVAEIEVVSSIDDVNYRDLFSTDGPVGIVANFAALPVRQSKGALRARFSSHRSGHLVVLADPDNQATLTQIAKSRELLPITNDVSGIRASICDTVATLLEAVPDKVASDSSLPIPGISIRFCSAPLGYTSYWTSNASYFSGLQTFPGQNSILPRLVAQGDSSVSIRQYGIDLTNRISENCKIASVEELLIIGESARDSTWKLRTRERIIV